MQFHWERALPVLAEAREYAARSGQVETADPRWIAAMAWHGVALCTAGERTEGQDLVVNALALARTHHGAESRASERALQCLAFTRLSCLGDAKGASAPMREAHAIVIKREPPGSINRAVQTLFLLSVLLDADQLDEIRSVLRETPMFDPSGPISPALSWIKPFMRAWEVLVHLRLGDPETAERVGEEAVALMKQDEADPTADHMLLDLLARALYANGKYARAESMELAALKELEKDLSDDPVLPSHRAWTLLQLSRIRSERANHQGALDSADQALASLSNKGAPSLADQAAVDSRRGRILFDLGRYTEAVQALAAADAYWQTHGGSGEVSYWYGKALIATGDTKRGEALVKSVLPGLAASDDPRARALAAREGVKPKETAALVRR
jgi:tetratricopeptide (TPR) repeat protein